MKSYPVIYKKEEENRLKTLNIGIVRPKCRIN